MRLVMAAAAVAALASCATPEGTPPNAAAFMQMNCAQLAQKQYNTQIRVTTITGKYYGDAFERNYIGARGEAVAAEKARFNALNDALITKNCDIPPDFIPVTETGGTASYWNNL